MGGKEIMKYSGMVYENGNHVVIKATLSDVKDAFDKLSKYEILGTCEEIEAIKFENQGLKANSMIQEHIIQKTEIQSKRTKSSRLSSKIAD